jgi:hypothetical protein
MIARHGFSRNIITLEALRAIDADAGGVSRENTCRQSIAYNLRPVTTQWNKLPIKRAGKSMSNAETLLNLLNWSSLKILTPIDITSRVNHHQI